MAATFLLTVFADLTVVVTEDYIEDGQVHSLQGRDIPGYLRIFRIHGPFLFGATEKISTIYDQMNELRPIVILRLRNMTAIDATGIQALETLAEDL